MYLLFVLYLFSLESDGNEGFTAAPTPDNLMVWNAVIFGYILKVKFLVTNVNSTLLCYLCSVIFCSVSVSVLFLFLFLSFLLARKELHMKTEPFI